MERVGAGADEVTGLADEAGLRKGRHRRVGDRIEPEKFEHRCGVDQRQVFPLGVGPKVFGGAADDDRAGGDQPHQLVLIDRHLLFGVGVIVEPLAEPVWERRGDAGDRFAVAPA